MDSTETGGGTMYKAHAWKRIGRTGGGEGVRGCWVRGGVRGGVAVSEGEGSGSVGREGVKCWVGCRQPAG
ncbi:hypothetical protein Hamer_G001891 [Homarus americanus]|uniref:Uncharacterized protein n=1 Tax=Homarus americanus TaxID=6706 RepID=A0A8J5JWH6_HOMAM|nr:hypothetical protein Hamer_G001891 [Homarus americanus]